MKIKELVGLQGLDYFDQLGTIIAAAHIKNWQSLKPYDNTGWLDPMEFKALGIDEENAILVAFQLHNAEDDEQPSLPDVYVFGGEGVTLAYHYPNLPVKEVIYKGENYRVVGTYKINDIGYVDIDKGNHTPSIPYEEYKSLEPYFKPEPNVWPTNPQKTKKFKTMITLELTENQVRMLLDSHLQRESDGEWEDLMLELEANELGNKLRLSLQDKGHDPDKYPSIYTEENFNFHWI